MANIDNELKQIKSAIYGKDIRGSIHDGIDKINNEVESATNLTEQTEHRQDAVEQQFDDLQKNYTEGSPSTAEIVAARTNTETGGNYPTLVKRLDDENKKVNQQLADNIQEAINSSANNPDFVERLTDLINVRGMYAISNNNELLIGIGLTKSPGTVVEYRFVYNDDDLLLLRGVRSGFEDTSKIRSTNGIDVTLKGDFNTNTSSLPYTTNVNDYFEFEFKGSSLWFERRVTTDGGLWEFVLDNGNTKRISCYSPTEKFERIKVFGDLEYGEYKGRAIFKGKDPLSPQINNPRGYLRRHDYALWHGNILPLDTTTARYVVSPESIPDFAIKARPTDKSYDHEWVPQHGNVDGTLDGLSMKIVINEEVELETPSQFPSWNYKEIKSFELMQRFKAQNPHGDDDMWQHYIAHTINIEKPYLNIQNRIELLTDIYVSLMYFNMLPSSQSIVERLVLNDGTEYKTIPVDNTEDNFEASASGALFAGNVGNGLYDGCAIQVGSLKEAVSLGKEIQPSNATRITFRNDDITKVYFTTAQDEVLLKDSIYSNSTKIIAVAGVRYPNVLLKSI